MIQATKIIGTGLAIIGLGLIGAGIWIGTEIWISAGIGICIVLGGLILGVSRNLNLKFVLNNPPSPYSFGGLALQSKLFSLESFLKNFKEKFSDPKLWLNCMSTGISIAVLHYLYSYFCDISVPEVNLSTLAVFGSIYFVIKQFFTILYDMIFMPASLPGGVSSTISNPISSDSNNLSMNQGTIDPNTAQGESSTQGRNQGVEGNRTLSPEYIKGIKDALNVNTLKCSQYCNGISRSIAQLIDIYENRNSDIQARIKSYEGLYSHRQNLYIRLEERKTIISSAKYNTRNNLSLIWTGIKVPTANVEYYNNTIIKADEILEEYIKK